MDITIAHDNLNFSISVTFLTILRLSALNENLKGLNSFEGSLLYSYDVLIMENRREFLLHKDFIKNILL